VGGGDGGLQNSGLKRWMGNYVVENGRRWDAGEEQNWATNEYQAMK